jgi:lipopolysaccharide transport system permease protein
MRQMEKALKHNENTDLHWDTIINPSKRYLHFNLGEVWRYRDLLMLFVKKDIITVYKQTILGPIWFLLQPVFITLTYMIIFGKMGGMADKTVPPILFFMGSVTLWNYFSDTLNTTSKTFTDNASVFGKVYFPRIILPLSKVMSGLIKFFIQFGLFILVWLYYIIFNKSGGSVNPNIYVFLFPALIIIMSLLSLGFGLIITSMTTKYRDLTFLISFGIQLFMFATPVIYPLNNYPKYRFWLFLNPLTSIFEAFKYSFLGSGILNFDWLLYSFLFTCVILILGIFIFNRVEKKFIDTV